MSPVFASTLRTLRQRRRLTQRELAEAAGFSQAYVSQLERGLRPLNPVDVVERFASALNVPPSRLELGAR
ncbi:MAG: helix-turn-helix transcriptional regulator [Vicinamibacterales bacterium]